MIEIGQICVKTAGRDAGSKCVVMSVNGQWAEVLGFRRRRRVNVRHLIPTKEKLDPKIGDAAIRKKLGVRTARIKKEEKKPKQSGVGERIAGVLGRKKAEATKKK